MKTTILGLAVLLGSIGFLTPDLRADGVGGGFGFSFGLGHGGPHFQASFGGGYGGGYRRAPVCAPPARVVHTRIPIYRQVWVPARYERVFAGYDFRGAPIYRTVEARCGYYQSVLVGYRCN